MKLPLLLAVLSATLTLPRHAAVAAVPENLVAEGIPPFSDELNRDAGRYLEFRAASFQGWHPVRRELLVATRFTDTPQLHTVKMPGGARQQLTFFAERVMSGAFRPKTGDCIVFAQDTGGSEFFQLHRYDLSDGRVTLLTDGKSRNTGAVWSKSGRWLAFSSTRRTGRDNDIYVMNPDEPGSARLVLEVTGGGWMATDWNRDDSRLIIAERLSINESYLHVLDVKSGALERITPKNGAKVAYSGGRFSPDGKSVYCTTDKDSEFHRLTRIDLATKRHTVLTTHIRWDVSEFALSPDGRLAAFVTNEDGVGVLHWMDTRKAKELRAPKLPAGIPSGLEWHENGRDLGFNFTSARSPADVYSANVKSGKVERWTESETGGINPAGFVEPDLVKITSFDGLGISGFLYRPDSVKFPGKRPVLIAIHGGPESQSRPVFQARNNYLLNELGIGILYPNVRGSAGYGKTFLTLDNGFKREDSVKDIGAFIQWLRNDQRTDGDRIAVYGGSYGGYMVLASMVHFNDQLRCGIDVVGISHFATFLKNTESYRRDLRRVEYGDERDPAMAAHFEKIAPLNQVKRIAKPMFVVQGKNDPRVPLTEAEQMVRALRENGTPVWYLMAKDEGHGFAKKKNADFQFLTMIEFLKEHLVGDGL